MISDVFIIMFYNIFNFFIRHSEPEPHTFARARAPKQIFDVVILHLKDKELDPDLHPFPSTNDDGKCSIPLLHLHFCENIVSEN
jgi:hypothetical protein